MAWYIVEEVDVDQDAHTATATFSRAAFDRMDRAICYAQQSMADAVTVSDPQGHIIYPEEAQV